MYIPQCTCIYHSVHVYTTVYMYIPQCTCILSKYIHISTYLVHLSNSGLIEINVVQLSECGKEIRLNVIDNSIAKTEKLGCRIPNGEVSQVVKLVKCSKVSSFQYGIL